MVEAMVRVIVVPVMTVVDCGVYSFGYTSCLNV